MIGMRKSRHRKGGVARQVSAPQTRIHLTWILPSRLARLVRPRRPGSTRRNRNNRKGIVSHASVNRDRGHL